LATLRKHTSGVFFVQFSADGTKLVSASGDGEVCLWDLCKLKGWIEPKAVKGKNPLQMAWDNLRSPEPLVAVRASERFLANPVEAIAFWNGISLAPKNPDPALVRKLIHQLGSKTFAARNEAQTQLATISECIEPLLKEAR